MWVHKKHNTLLAESLRYFLNESGTVMLVRENSRHFATPPCMGFLFIAGKSLFASGNVGRVLMQATPAQAFSVT